MEQTEVPSIPQKSSDFDCILNLLTIQSSCVRTKFEYMKRWHEIFLKHEQNCNISDSDLEFDKNMRRWFQTFEPINVLDDFSSDAGLMLFDSNECTKKLACKSIRQLKIAKKKNNQTKRNGKLLFPIPIRYNSNREMAANNRSISCSTPPPRLTINEHKTTPEERARYILSSSNV